MMKLNGVEIEFTCQDASGREQALRLAAGDLPDFIIAADAPMFLTPEDHVRWYLKRLDLHSEEQRLLVRLGRAAQIPITIWVYPNSSASHQLAVLTRGHGGRKIVPSTCREESLELSDYGSLAGRMKPGDMVFAWQPLLSNLERSGLFESVAGSEFLVTISIYQRPDWNCDIYRGHTQAFIDCFIGAWRQAERRPLAAWAALFCVKSFYQSLSRGIAGHS